MATIASPTGTATSNPAKFCPEPGRALRVTVAIRPGAGAALDAEGRSLHCRWELSTKDNGGPHATIVPEYAPASGTTGNVVIETDGGSFVVDRRCSLAFIGGAGEWDVIVSASECEPAPFEFQLTTTPGRIAVVTRPEWHSRIRTSSGQLTVNTKIITDPTGDVSLSEPTIETTADTVYVTTGKV